MARTDSAKAAITFVCHPASRRTPFSLPPHADSHVEGVHVGIQLLHALPGSDCCRIVPSTGDGKSQAFPELAPPFVVVLGVNAWGCQLRRIRRRHRPEMSQRPEAGQPYRTVILREKVNESIVIQIPWSRFASTEECVAQQRCGVRRESPVGTHGRTQSVREPREHGRCRADKFARSVTFEQSR